MQILRDLYQVAGSLNGVSWLGDYKSYGDSNVYVLRGAGGAIMFDCGNGETWSQILENLHYWGVGTNEIKACFLTHAHHDHAGAAHILSEAGIKIFAHQETADSIESGDERCAGYLYHKKFFPCKCDVRLVDNQCISLFGFDIEVMHLPGHTGGCAAYVFRHEGKKVIVSGDVIGTLQDGYFGWDGSFDFDKRKYLNSLLRFSRIDSDMMLPGHGMIYFKKPRQRVEEALSAAYSDWR